MLKKKPDKPGLKPSELKTEWWLAQADPLSRKLLDDLQKRGWFLAIRKLSPPDNRYEFSIFLQDKEPIVIVHANFIEGVQILANETAKPQYREDIVL